MKISPIMSISKILTKMLNKTKYENKKNFCRYCLKCFNSEKVLMEHKKVCLNINGKQRLELGSGSITFNNYFK